MNNTDPDYLFNFDVDSNILVVAFAGIAQKFGSIPAFEFMNILSKYPVKKMFIRDRRTQYFLSGVPGLGNSVEEMAANIKKLGREHGITKTIFIGASMGGYAALLFGALVCANQIIAFCPRTFLNLHLRFWYRDFRRFKNIPTYECSRCSRKYFDLKKLFQSLHVSQPQVQIYFGQDRIDQIHAKRLASFPNVKLLYHPITRKHDLVKRLKDNGLLIKILSRSFSFSS